MSPGWLDRSLSSGPPGAFAFSSGNTGAATTYPALVQASSSSEYGCGVTANPCPNTISGNGPAGSPARVTTGYRTIASKDRRTLPIVRDGSTSRTVNSPTRYGGHDVR